ncbi:MAG: hypothetical protein EAZ57_07270 [Cytophagales bacterium]|nr:MAG: hypothetical protein EAZ67_08080 [Cytophagales bacterium]TAF60501.1 MAG: hypothetical protein EAZ57_07270 [Cytophagales bacterium]
MSIVNKIRNRAGIAVGVVAVAMGLFIVGSDLISPSNLFSSEQMIGVLDGTDISRNRFAEEVEKFKAEMKVINNVDITEREAVFARGRAWERLVQEEIMTKEYEKLGIEVTQDELVDMVQGNNIVPELAPIFTNKATGKVDRNKAIEFIQNLQKAAPEDRMSFLAFEQTLKPRRLLEKYTNVLRLTTFVTNAEARRRFEEQNNKYTYNYMFVNFATISDSVVKVSDSELQAFYDKNKYQYTNRASVSLDYLVFDVKPSALDSNDLKKELANLSTAFSKAENDSFFVNQNSDINADSKIKKFVVSRPQELPESIRMMNTDSLKVGSVVGPFADGDNMLLYKFLGKKQDSVYSMRARHILVKVDDSDTTKSKDIRKAEARKKAQDILDRIKKGESFASLASMYGTDGTRNVGGDLGWFSEKAMVAPFEKAVMSASSRQLLPNLVETDFGFHVVEVTEPKQKTLFSYACISRKFMASDATRDGIYQRAGRFVNAENTKAFTDMLNKEKDMLLLQANTVKRSAANINNIYGPSVRQIVLWAFSEDTKIGSISDVFELEDKYIVALLREKYDLEENEIAPLACVKEEILPEARKEVKAKMIMDKLNKLPKGTAQAMAQAYGKDAFYNTADAFAYATYTIVGAGFSPRAIGKMAAMKPGDKTGFFVDENGICMIELTKVDKAAEVADYNQFKLQVQQDRTTTLGTDIFRALQHITNSTNNIDKFY